MEGQGSEVAEGRRLWPPRAPETGLGLSGSPGSSRAEGEEPREPPGPYPPPTLAGLWTAAAFSGAGAGRGKGGHASPGGLGPAVCGRDHPSLPEGR